MKNKIKRIVTDTLYFTLGSFVYSFAITCVLAPAHISPGGITGVATVLNYLFSLPIGMTALVLNIPLLILGFLKFGMTFIARTAAATTISSLLLDLVTLFVPKIHLEGILAAIFGGVLLGLGLGTVLLRGATTGGTDIAAKLINTMRCKKTVTKPRGSFSAGTVCKSGKTIALCRFAHSFIYF